jgi:hypothetical protein
MVSATVFAAVLGEVVDDVAAAHGGDSLGAFGLILHPRRFGQMTNGIASGRAAQYGVPSAWFFGNLEGPIRPLPHC